MVARDWRGGKVFYREWSKMRVEWWFERENGEGLVGVECKSWNHEKGICHLRIEETWNRG